MKSRKISGFSSEQERNDVDAFDLVETLARIQFLIGVTNVVKPMEVEQLCQFLVEAKHDFKR